MESRPKLVFKFVLIIQELNTKILCINQVQGLLQKGPVCNPFWLVPFLGNMKANLSPIFSPKLLV